MRYTLKDFYSVDGMYYFPELNGVWVDEDGFVQFKEHETRNEVYKYIAKYPNTHKKVLNNPKYKGYQKDTGMALAMGIERHLKARKLLFKILERKIEGWWD